MDGESLGKYALAWNVSSTYFPSFEEDHKTLPSDERCRVHKKNKLEEFHLKSLAAFLCICLCNAVVAGC